MLSFPLLAAMAHGAAITIGSATVQRQHQEEATLCVSLALRGSERIAGVENELVWDDGCASILEGSCTESGGHGKKLSGASQKTRTGTYKALLLSFTDTDPMPAGPLYCCNFLVHTNPGRCCRVRVTNAGASDPDGNALPVENGPPGQLCVASDGRGVGGSGGLGSGGFGGGNLGGGTGNVGGGGGNLGGGTGDLGGGTGDTGGGIASGGGNTVLPGGGGDTVAPSGGGNTVVPGGGGNVVSGGGAQNLTGGDAAGGSEAAAGGDAGGPSAGGAPSGNVLQPGVDGVVPPVPGGGQMQRPPSGNAVAPARPQASGPPQVQQQAAPAIAATPRAAQDEATPGATPQSDANAVPADAGAQPTSQPAAEAESGEAATGEAEKPSPRDVAPVAAQGVARPRRMPLDEEDGWFGCQTTGAGSSAWPGAAPLLLLLLARRRRRI